MGKNIKRKCTAIFLIITLLTILLQSNIYAAQDYPYIQGISGILMEYHTGEVLYEKKMDDAVFPASTTKLMTALLAMEHLDINGSYTIPGNFPNIGGSTINIKKGETFTIRDLIMATLLNSANDASTALAYAVSGSVEDFSILMNQRATSIGCTKTNFVNPSGLHDANHYTTAKDMALISREFIKNEELFEMAGTATHTIPHTNISDSRVLKNTNRFITGDKVEGENFKIDNNGTLIPVTYEIVDGLKTGTTPQAGNCLVSTAQIDNLRVISVVFGSTENKVYSDSRYMIDYGLENYVRTEIIGDNTIIKTIKNFIATPESVDLIVKEGYSYIEPNTISSNIAGEAKLDKIKLPLVEGQQVGTFTIKNFDTNTIIKELPIYAATDFESRISWTYLGKSTFGKIFRVLFVGVVLIGAVVGIYLYLQQHRHKDSGKNRKGNKKNR